MTSGALEVEPPWGMQTPALIRYSMAGLFVLGAVTALLGPLLQLWFLPLGIESALAGNCFLSLSLGLFAGVALCCKASHLLGQSVRFWFVVSGILGSLSLIALSTVYVAAWLPPVLFWVGLSMGVLGVAASRLLGAAMTAPGARAAMASLAGVSVGSGAVAACLPVWALSGVGTGFIISIMAVLPILLAFSAGKQRAFQSALPSAPSPWPAWKEIENPRSILLWLSLLCQSAGQWIVGGWLALFLTRKHGAGIHEGLLALSVFWLAATCSRLAAPRLPPNPEHIRPLLVSLGAVVLGCVVSLQSGDTAAILAAALLLGAGMGVMQPVTAVMIAKRPAYNPPGLLLNAFFGLFVAGILAAGLAGHLAELLGIEIIIWFTLGFSVLVFLLQTAVYADAKLSSRAVTAK